MLATLAERKKSLRAQINAAKQVRFSYEQTTTTTATTESG